MNLQNSDSAAINPLLPGVRVYALIGFCDIHHFEDINLKLSTDGMTTGFTDMFSVLYSYMRVDSLKLYIIALKY